MAVNLSPIGNDAPFVDSSGNPASGYSLYTYTAGSTTPENTYTTSAGSVANANPIVLNSSGYPASGGNVVQIYLTAGVSYKFVLKDGSGNTIWTRDNISGINDTTVTIDQWVSGPAPTYISATSFSLVGDQTSTFQVGRRVKTTNSGGTVYSTIITSSYSVLTTVVVANDSGALDSGLSAVSYGLLSADSISLPTIVQRVGASSGRITLTSGTPVMTSDVTAATTVYFTQYNGNTVPIYDGGKFLQMQFTELSQATTDATKSPAAVTTNSNYDLFVWNDSGTIRLSRGPAWSSSTSRGTGAGTTELEMVKGVYLNKVAITNGPAAQRGTYVGTIRSNGSSQIDWKLGSAAAGGGEAWLGVWNMYNRVDERPRVQDSVDSYTYQSGTVRSMNNSNTNRISVIRGMDDDAVLVQRTQLAQISTSADQPHIGLALDATNTLGTAPAEMQQLFTGSSSFYQKAYASYGGRPGIGWHFWQATEKCNGTTAPCTFYGDSGTTDTFSNSLTATMRA